MYYFLFEELITLVTIYPAHSIHKPHCGFPWLCARALEGGPPLW